MNQHDLRMSLDEENFVRFGSADHLSFMQVVVVKYLDNHCKIYFLLKFRKSI